MHVKRLADPGVFLAAAEPLLLEDEARHNLMLGIAGTLRDYPSVYPEFHLWLVEDDGFVVGAAMQTPPYNLAVARPTEDGALTALANALNDDGVELPGVTGAVPEVDDFAAAWERRSGKVPRQRMKLRIYRLIDVRPVVGVSGRPRTATVGDRDLLVTWVRAFAKEAIGEGVDEPERMVRARLQASGAGFMLWENPGPVSLASWGGETPNGVRISAVYTPPEHRRRGYGSAVTAAVSAERLAAGRRFCFLYTDLANPTSNKIYTDIGYEPVCDSVDYAFDRS